MRQVLGVLIAGALLTASTEAKERYPAHQPQAPSASDITVESVPSVAFWAAERWTDRNGVTCYVVNSGPWHATSISCVKAK